MGTLLMNGLFMERGDRQNSIIHRGQQSFVALTKFNTGTRREETDELVEEWHLPEHRTRKANGVAV